MRGGKGKAGGRKHLWIQTVKYHPDRYKKVGFKPPSSLEKEAETVNVGELRDLVIKTLGTDKVKGPLSIKVSDYTSRALEKIEAAGGQILESE
jgi:large subunit ribosomal protein L15